MSTPLSNATVAIDCRLGSGIRTIVKNVVPRLSKRLRRVILLGSVDPRLFWNIGAENVEYVRFDARVYDPREQYRFPWKILRGTDLLHVPHYNVPLLWPKPLVVTLNDLAQFIPEFGASPLKRLFARAFIRWSLWRANEALTLSEYSRDDFTRQFGQKARRLKVVYPGVDTTVFRPIDRMTAWHRLQQEIGVADPYLLAIGSVRPHKNVSALIDAYATAKNDLGLKHKLVIAGAHEGFLTNARISIPRELRGDVRFTGRVADSLLPILYGCADAFVFASLYEGFGLPPLEAMACGVPTVVSNRTSLPEVVGDASVLIDPSDRRAFAHAIYHAVTDPKLREILIQAGKLRAAKFGWDLTSQRYLETYERALES
jgi:glycosyltransferase involved in cell wall biosynthesis